MAQWLKCLPCKLEDLSLIPGTCAKASCAHLSAIAREAETEESLDKRPCEPEGSKTDPKNRMGSD